ncbi:hypothetical protein Mapa_013356 [Marchantia paleacea]|nr:hypothetical protein Mapa_013356 [Marchantia paleacea]
MVGAFFREATPNSGDSKDPKDPTYTASFFTQCNQFSLGMATNHSINLCRSWPAICI